jgi:hypothetical protein
MQFPMDGMLENWQQMYPHIAADWRVNFNIRKTTKA